VCYAHLHGLPGYAILTPTHEALFVDHDAHFTSLTDADVPALTMLGLVDLAERQNLLDTLASGAAAIACSRRQEV
jgi:hypothetical protein